MLLVANLANTKWCKIPEKWLKPWNMGIVLIWECSAKAIQWIPYWQGLDGFQKSLRPCALDERIFGRVSSTRNVMNIYLIYKSSSEIGANIVSSVMSIAIYCSRSFISCFLTHLELLALSFFKEFEQLCQMQLKIICNLDPVISGQLNPNI